MRGNTRVSHLFLTLGILSLFISLIGLNFDAPTTFKSYLYSYLYWSDLPLGALSILMVFYLTGGDWGLEIHQTMKSLIKLIPLFALLFLPILIGMKKIYPWLDPATNLDPKIQHKEIYLNFFSYLIRSIFYFVVLIYFSYSLQRHSENSIKLQKLSSAGLILLSFIFTFQSVDWQMSVEPKWYSTIYGMVFIIGQCLSSFSFCLFFSGFEKSTNSTVSKKTLRDLANVLLTLVMTWAYLSFMQYLIIWSGNLPHEVTWFHHRTQGGWQWLVFILFIFQFSIPFLLLLFQSSKNQPIRLAFIGSLVLLIRLVEHYWFLMPGFHPEQFQLPWQIFTTWIGIGGVCTYGFLKGVRQNA